MHNHPWRYFSFFLFNYFITNYILGYYLTINMITIHDEACTDSPMSRRGDNSNQWQSPCHNCPRQPTTITTSQQLANDWWRMQRWRMQALKHVKMTCFKPWYVLSLFFLCLLTTFLGTKIQALTTESDGRQSQRSHSNNNHDTTSPYDDDMAVYTIFLCFTYLFYNILLGE